MYLSKLELHGFKSFADRTVVEFSPGVTVVVGPNGCGKSNIVDAVRWVIGEQRARILRSEKMDNIIFNGTSSRRSLGMSEVLLTIENTKGILPTEYGEVTIGRRLFRSGESEYLLNGVQCRLKDITDLFMDTGMGAGAYSVIELKMIEDILSDNAQDRRHMFEEAAGITKYKIRRNQTLRKLGSTQADLDRVRDLVEELDRRVSSLQRQAQKASRYKTLDERLHHLVLSLAARDYDSLSEEDAELERLLLGLGDQISGISATLANEEATHEAERKTHIEKEQGLVSAQTILSEHVEMLRSAETDLRLNTERSDGINRDLSRAAEETEKASLRRTALAEIRERIKIDLERALPEVETSSERLHIAKTERDAIEEHLATKRGERLKLAEKQRELLSNLTDRKTRIERLSSKLEMLDDELTEGISNRSQVDDRLEYLGGQVSEAGRILEHATTQHESSNLLLEKARNQRLVEQDKLDKIESELHQSERQLDALEAKIGLLESILSTHEEFSDSVQFLAASPDWSDSPAQTVADLLACDDEYRTALSQALGSYASCLVVESESAVGAAIARLRTEEKGRATFVLLSRLKTRGVEPTDGQIAGAVPMSTIVRTPSAEYDGLVEALLGSSFLVDDLEKIQRDKPRFGRFFTESGEWYDAVGMRYGGSLSKGTSPAGDRLGRREQHQRALAARDEVLGLLKGLRGDVEKTRDIVESLQIDALETNLQDRKSDVAEAEKQLSRITYEREILRRRRDEIVSRQEQLQESRESAQNASQALADGLAALQVETDSSEESLKDAEITLAKEEEESISVFSQFNEANIIAVQARHRVEYLEQEERRTIEDQNALEEETRARSIRVTLLKQELQESAKNAAALDKEIQTMRARRGELDSAVSDAKDELMTVKVAISDLESRLRELRKDREQGLAEESRHSIRRAEIKTRLEDLVQTISEDFEIDLHTLEYDVDEDFDAKEARIEISAIRGKIRNLGPINALALDSFEGEKERLEFLRKQLTDLEQAELTLRTTIDEINETASQRFESTLGAIQDNFQSLFRELFGEGASAEIVLEDPSDPLESSIDVLAKPSGKKPSVLAQLSGGEKTLTAIALLFSIYLVKPSPFCILDEVDAPLDDANVDRFMHLIRTFSDSTQFVLVTHNKRTMEAADRMYGITMQEKGISQLVGVKFDRDLSLVA